MLKKYVKLVLLAILVWLVASMFYFFYQNTGCNWKPTFEKGAYGFCNAFFPVHYYDSEKNQCTTAYPEGCGKAGPFGYLEECTNKCVKE
ncbi:MAG: hypothetical protein AAB932_03300 [Patescibacteria group bacterium]